MEDINIPEEGRQVHLRAYVWITVFKFVAKNGRIDYLATSKERLSRDEMKDMMASRWRVAVFHQELKQRCGIERCQDRHSRSERNHILMAIMAWFNKHKRRIREKK